MSEWGDHRDDETSDPTGARPLDGYRRQPKRALRRLLPPALLLIAGSLIAGFGLARVDLAHPHLRQSRGHLLGPAARPVDGSLPPHPWLPFAVGFSVLLVGAGLGVFRLRQQLMNEDHILLSTEGVVIRENDRLIELDWSEVESVRHDPETDTVELRMRGYEEGYRIRERYMATTPAALAGRMEEIRRKSTWGVY